MLEILLSEVEATIVFGPIFVAPGCCLHVDSHLVDELFNLLDAHIDFVGSLEFIHVVLLGVRLAVITEELETDLRLVIEDPLAVLLYHLLGADLLEDFDSP